jgi:hypothetical protein
MFDGRTTFCSEGKFHPGFAGKRGGWGVFAENVPYRVDAIGVVWWLPGVFGALLCTFVAHFGASATVFEGFCLLDDCFDCALLGSNSRQRWAYFPCGFSGLFCWVLRWQGSFGGLTGP